MCNVGKLVYLIRALYVHNLLKLLGYHLNTDVLLAISLPCGSTSIGSTIGSPKSHLNSSDNLDNNSRLLSNTGLVVLRTDSKSTYWKTKLCIKWEITGQCPFGDRCHFAHGQAELKLLAGRIQGEAIDFNSLPRKVISELDAATDVSPTIAVIGVPPAPV